VARARRKQGDGLNLGQAFPQCIFGETGHRLNIQFPHQVFTVSMDGLEAQVQLGRDLFDGFLFCQELQDLALPVGQLENAEVGAAAAFRT